LGRPSSQHMPRTQFAAAALDRSRAKEAPDLMLSCAKVRELQSETRGGTVSSWQRLGLWLHMRLCAPCARTDKSLCATLSLLRELGTRDEKPSDRS
jgi:hypothetical protein